MKNKLLLLLIATVVLTIVQSGCKKQETWTPNWKIGIQTYTFHKFPLMEALDMSQKLGLEYAESFFFQELGKGFVDTAYLNYDIDEATKTQLKAEFKKRNITPYSFGVAFYGSNEEWNQFFAFAHEMGIKTVTAEPTLEQLDYVEQLAIKYNIEVAIHNHPNPSVYANPDVLEKTLEGRNRIIGVCADIGHWKRTGNEPVATLKRFEGKLKVVHLKDLSTTLEDTTWGTGVLPVKEVLEELKRQNFDGLISIEYENFSDSQVEDIRKSLEYYNTQLSALK